MCIRDIINWFINWDTRRMQADVELSKQTESIQEDINKLKLKSLELKTIQTESKARLANTKLKIAEEKKKNVITKHSK
jgi:hypothetical protein